MCSPPYTLSLCLEGWAKGQNGRNKASPPWRLLLAIAWFKWAHLLFFAVSSTDSHLCLNPALKGHSPFRLDLPE